MSIQSLRSVVTVMALSMLLAACATPSYLPEQTTYQTVEVDGVSVFYRAAGAEDAPVLLLLHGFPSSSHQYRELIPTLADRYRVIAPDFPGFGSTEVPDSVNYEYTFDNLAKTIDGFTRALELDRYALYVFDYGAPVGFRLAMNNPEKITAIITQNGNAYEEGLSAAWGPIRAYWQEDTLENRNALRPFLNVDTTTWQYYEGAREDRRHLISPDSIAHDQAILDRDADIQLDLFKSYASNVAAYPDWQQYLRQHQPPVLAVWASNDPFFPPAGAEAFKQDVPDAQIEFVDAGHFPLETHLTEISQSIRSFLGDLNL